MSSFDYYGRKSDIETIYGDLVTEIYRWMDSMIDVKKHDLSLLIRYWLS